MGRSAINSFIAADSARLVNCESAISGSPFHSPLQRKAHSSIDLLDIYDAL